MIYHGLVLKMLLVLHNFVLVHKRILATRGATSAFITSHVVFLGASLPTMHAIARIGLVDYYGRVFTANDPQWKPKEARKPHISSRKRSAQTGTSHFTRS